VVREREGEREREREREERRRRRTGILFSSERKRWEFHKSNMVRNQLSRRGGNHCVPAVKTEKKKTGLGRVAARRGRV
jgi:hypothetical protein